MNIRWRLTLWNAAGVAAVLVGFAALVYALAARSIRQQADRTADAGFRLIDTDPKMAADSDKRAGYWVHEFDEHMGVLAAVYRADGTPLAAHPGVSTRHPAAPPAGRGLETDPDGHGWRVAVADRLHGRAERREPFRYIGQSDEVREAHGGSSTGGNPTLLRAVRDDSPVRNLNHHLMRGQTSAFDGDRSS